MADNEDILAESGIVRDEDVLGRESAGPTTDIGEGHDEVTGGGTDEVPSQGGSPPEDAGGVAAGAPAQLAAATTSPPASRSPGSTPAKLSDEERLAIAAWQVGQQDVTLMVTVLLSEQGDEVPVVIGAQRGERCHTRFLRLRVPREAWAAALFGDPAEEIAEYDLGFVAEAASDAARAIMTAPRGYKSTKGDGPPASRKPRAARAKPETPVPATQAGTAATLAQRRAGTAPPVVPAPGTTRRSLFDLDEF